MKEQGQTMGMGFFHSEMQEVFFFSTAELCLAGLADQREEIMMIMKNEFGSHPVMSVLCVGHRGRT